MKTYKRKPSEIKAFQYTQEMQDKFVALGVGYNENPINVSLEGVEDGILEWNWSIKQLMISERYWEARVMVGNYIFLEHGEYGVITESELKEEYETD